MECSCCGEDRDPAMVAALLCHDDIRICRICIEWLMPRAGGIDVTPSLPVSDMPQAIRFYETAGFEVEPYDDGFAFVGLSDQSAFYLNLNPAVDPATNSAGCYIVVHDVDGWHDRLVAAGLAATAVEDMPWGMHEFTLSDPSGNHIRIGHSVEG
jgi:predicted enzyme related to lactoylglutathione lyase